MTEDRNRQWEYRTKGIDPPPDRSKFGHDNHHYCHNSDPAKCPLEAFRHTRNFFEERPVLNLLHSTAPSEID